MDNKKIQEFKKLISKIGSIEEINENEAIIRYAIKDEKRIDELTKFINENNINFNHLSEKYEDCEKANIDFMKLHCKIFEMKGIPKEKYKSILEIISRYKTWRLYIKRNTVKRNTEKNNAYSNIYNSLKLRIT